jgi:hypothetical protein
MALAAGAMPEGINPRRRRSIAPLLPLFVFSGNLHPVRCGLWGSRGELEGEANRERRGREEMGEGVRCGAVGGAASTSARGGGIDLKKYTERIRLCGAEDNPFQEEIGSWTPGVCR